MATEATSNPAGNMADYVQSRIQQINAGKDIKPAPSQEKDPKTNTAWASEAEERASAADMSTKPGTLLGDSIVDATKDIPEATPPAASEDQKEMEVDKTAEMTTQGEILSEMSRDMQKKQERRSSASREGVEHAPSGSLDTSKERTKAKEKTPSEEIKEAKNMAEALIAFNKNKGFERPDLMGDFAGKCAEFGKVDDAMDWTKRASETANSLRDSETQKRSEMIIGAFEGSVNKLGMIVDGQIEGMQRVATKLNESAELNSRASHMMFNASEAGGRQVVAMSQVAETMDQSTKRMQNAAEVIDESSRRMNRGGY